MQHNQCCILRCPSQTLSHHLRGASSTCFRPSHVCHGLAPTDPFHDRCIIRCPSQTSSSPPTHMHHGPSAYTDPFPQPLHHQVPKPDIVITTYEALSSDAPALRALPWAALVIDQRGH